MTRRRALALAVGLLPIAVYARALFVGFFSDDYQVLGRMAATLSRPDFVFSVFYRDFNPLLHAWFAADYVVGGGAPWAFHASSILAHAIAAALVYLLAARLSGNAWLGFACAATWAVGVRISEAVIWPVSRGHVLATMLSLAAILLLLEGGAWRLTAAVALFAGALLSKETGLFPMILAPWLVDDRALRRKLIVVLGVIAVAFVGLNFALKPEFHTAGEGVWSAVRKLPFVVLRPLGLGDLYGFTVPGFAMFVVGAAAAVVATWRTPARAGVLWVLVCALPILPLQKVSSRYLYMLSAGYPLAIAGLARHPWAARLSAGARRTAALAVGAGACLLILANALLVQREIDDYRIMGEPYARCFAAIQSVAATLAPGETLIVVETKPHTAIAELAERLRERGTLNKLLPERREGIGGLIDLPDAINGARHRGAALAVAADPSQISGPYRAVAWNGAGVHSVDSPPIGRALAARMVPVAEFVRAARALPK